MRHHHRRARREIGAVRRILLRRHRRRLGQLELEGAAHGQLRARPAVANQKAVAGLPAAQFGAAAGDDQLISLSDAELAATREYTDKDIEGSPRIIGVDPARFGDDRSVIVLRQGLRMEKPMIHHGVDNMQLAGIVANLIEDRDPDAVFIDSGAGAGVIDRLRQLDYYVMEVPFGGKANYPNLFVNRRAEMWWAMKEWISNGGAIPNDTTLKQELLTPTYWYDAVGRRVLEGKDEIKKRLQGGGSPDIADALALTFAYPVAKQLPREVRERLDPTPRDHDPYEDM